jgi:hypothetical protein
MTEFEPTTPVRVIATVMGPDGQEPRVCEIVAYARVGPAEYLVRDLLSEREGIFRARELQLTRGAEAPPRWPKSRLKPHQRYD